MVYNNITLAQLIWRTTSGKESFKEIFAEVKHANKISHNGITYKRKPDSGEWLEQS